MAYRSDCAECQQLKTEFDDCLTECEVSREPLVAYFATHGS
jgi:hypothetical protein